MKHINNTRCGLNVIRAK